MLSDSGKSIKEVIDILEGRIMAIEKTLEEIKDKIDIIYKNTDTLVKKEQYLQKDEREKLLSIPTADENADAVWNKDLG